MTPYEIPLSPEPQRFAIELGGAPYLMRFYWNKDDDTGGCWCIDLLDSDGNDLVLGISVVTGIDLLKQYRYLGVGGSIVAQTDHDPDEVPAFDNLGTSGRVYFLVQ